MSDNGPENKPLDLNELYNPSAEELLTINPPLLKALKDGYEKYKSRIFDKGGKQCLAFGAWAKNLGVIPEPYILPDTAITEFAEKTAYETNVEKIEALLMEFVQEHFQFRV